MKKRFSAILLILCMLIALLPVSVQAADTTMTRHDVIDKYTSDSFPVNALDTGAQADFVDVTVPDGGATVIIYFSAQCGNSASLIQQLSRFSWIASEHIKIVALDTNGNDQATVQSFVDSYAGDAVQYIDFYYNDTNDHMWATVQQLYGSTSITYPLVVIVTESEGVRTINYADIMMTSPAKLYNSLAELLPEFAESTTGNLPGVVEVTAAGIQCYSEAADVFALVNENRIANGSSKVSYNATLTELAMQRAAEIAVYYSHTRPNGTSFSAVSDGIYTNYSTLGENIAAGQTDAADVMNSWMNSSGHRANILNTSFTQIGIGCYESNGIRYWVQLFGDSVTDTAVTSKTTDTVAQVPVQVLKSNLHLSPSTVTEKSLRLTDTFTTALVNLNDGDDYFTAILIPQTLSVDTSVANITIDEYGTITVTPAAMGQCELLLKAYDGQTDPGGYRFDIVEKIYYNVILNSCIGGTVTANYTTATEGTTIKITSTPDAGYEFTDFSLEIPAGYSLTYGKAMNVVQFKMPAFDVVFTPVFTAIDCDHEPNTSGASAATCTEPGNTGTTTCTKCGTVLGEGEVIPATGHDYASVVTEPTCTADGYTTHTCINCGSQYTDSIVSKTGHTEVIDKAADPTCTDSGLTEGKHCSTCGTVLTAQKVVSPKGHTEEITAEAVAKTCTETGLTAQIQCSVCGVVLEAQEIIPAGHDFGSWTQTVAPTVTEYGEEKRVCGTCGAIEFRPIDKLVIAQNFTDVLPGAYYEEAVQWAVENGVTTGLTATTFGPNVDCTRGQVVTFLWRAAGCPEPSTTKTPFTDLQHGAYYYKAVLWAVENGITTGLTHTTFGPDATCTRGQVVTFLHRFAGSPAPTSSSHSFKDVSASGYYYSAMLWAVENGVTTGLTATTFGPDENCTRGQIVTFLYRALA